MKKFMKYFSKSLAILLSVLTIISVMPMQTFATEALNYNALGEVSTDAHMEAMILEEVVEERSANSKTYLLDDGTYCDVFFSNNIHEFVDGNWKDIGGEISYSEETLTVNEASAEISSQLSTQIQTYSTNVNDGLVIFDSNKVSLNITQIQYNENTEENEGSEENDENTPPPSDCLISTGSALLSESSYGIVSFNLTSIKNYEKTEATIKADLYMDYYSEDGEDANTIVITPFNLEWDESTVQFDDVFSQYDGNPVLDYNEVTEYGQATWDVTSEYIKMENGVSSSNEMLIAQTDSYEISVSNAYLQRYYRVIDDNDTGFSYHNVDMGRAGTVYINDYTNVAYLERNELSISGNILPVSISTFVAGHVDYNTYGAGGRINYNSKIYYSSDTITWDMFNGSSVRFKRSSDGETDSNGLEKWTECTYNTQGYTLWVNPNSLTNLEYTGNYIEDEEGNKYTVNGRGYIISIISKDNSNDKINIQYENNKIVSISDGVGRVYNFEYKAFSGIIGISAITAYTLQGEGLLEIELPVTEVNEEGKEVPVKVKISYNYEKINGKLYLKQATYSDKKTVEYNYDSIGRLLSIKNIDNSILELHYAIPEASATQNKNPIYWGRLEGYTKKVFDKDNNCYMVDYTVNINADNTYRRVFTQINEPMNTQQNSVEYYDTYQFNRNLDVLYSVDSSGNTFYAEYNDTHELLSLVIPNNANNLLSLKNGAMNPNGSSKVIPATWSRTNISNKASANQSKMLIHDGTENDYYIQIYNDSSTTRALHQSINIDDGKAGDKYVISAWGLGEATVPKEDRFWGIKISGKNDDGEYIQIHTMTFDTTLWGVEQTRATAFALPFDTTSLKIELISQNQLGSVSFDDICLYKTDIAYVAEVDEINNIENTCDCENCKYSNCACECESEDVCNCTSCDISESFLNDTHGNSSTESKSNGLQSLISQYEYTDDFNYLSKYTNENKVSTSYEYTLTNGLLMSKKFDDDATINYQYDAIGALTSVSQTIKNIRDEASTTNMLTTYSYENDKISSITHNGFSYDYEYDIYGNIKSISVNNTPLITYSYNNDYYKNIGTITYGNGDKLSYTYDERGNITEIYIGNEEKPKYEYEYDAYNNLVTYTDNSNNTITSYNKTIGEKTYEIVVQRIDDAETIIYSIEAGSDSSYVESVFGRDYSISKTISYDSATGNSTAITTTPVILFNEGGKATVTTTSDSLDRRIEEKLKFTTDVVDYQNASIEVKNEYTYKNVDSSQTTKLIETFKATLITTDENGISTTEELINLKYKYDSAGRITTIYEYRLSGVSGYYHPIALYKYDDAGQLIAEAHGYSNEVWGYTYDAGGNITSKNKLNYNDVIVEDVENPDFKNLDKTTPLKTITYDYHDTYKDLLVSFDDETISYDDAGNPLNYHGYIIGGETSMNFSWAGRNLVEAVTQDGDSKFKYTYDASGIRTKKEIYEQESFTIATTDANGNPTTESKSEFIKTCAIEYVWSNGMIVAQKVSTYSPVEDENGYYVMDDKEVAVVENDDSIIVKPLYNDFNEPLGVNCYITTEDGEQSETFYFIKDAQGNIRSIYSMENDYTINMNYDAFGNYSLDLSGDAIDEMQNSIINANGELNQTLAKIVVGIAMTVMVCITFTAAPHSYRGYIYDIETGLYYCQSRYYSPSWGRFINADEASILEMTVGEVHGANIFAYCNNDPVNLTDPDGHLAQALVGGFLGGLLAFGLYYLEYLLGMRVWNYVTMIGIVAYNVLISAGIWFMGLGGKLQKFLKLYGVAQKVLKNSKNAKVIISALSIFPKGLKAIGNLIIKKATRYPGESWPTAIMRFVRQQFRITV